MASLLILTSLLASTLFSCEAFLFGSKNQAAECKDPVSCLSDVLVQLTDDKTLAGNIDAAFDHNWRADSQKVKNPVAFQQAVTLFLELNPDDISDPINLANVQKLRNLAGKRNIEFNLHKDQQRRVFGLLQKFEAQLHNDGFYTYEELWMADASRQNIFQQQFGGLIHLSALLAGQTDPEESKFGASFRELSGAIALTKNPKAVAESKVEDVASVMAEIHKMKRYKNGLKLNAKVGLTAKKLLNDYLVEPCEALMKQPEVDTIFEPIKRLALSVNLREAATNFEESNEWWSVLWASRYIFCEVLVHKTDLRELAEKLAQS